MTAAKSVKILPLGIVFDEKAPPAFSDWETLGKQLVAAEKCLGFYIGDWLNFGEKHWGEKYKEAAALTCLDYGTLRNYAYVARSVPLSCRHDKLTFEHHARVAPLEPALQKKWLGVAAAAIERGESFGKRRLARSIEAGRVVPIEKIAERAEDKSFATYLLQITRLRAFWRDLKDSGRVAELDELQREAIRNAFSLLEQTRQEMLLAGLWPAEPILEMEKAEAVG